jgi:hypothetical protein
VTKAGGRASVKNLAARAGIAATMVAPLAWLSATPASAYIDGPCTAEGHAVSGRAVPDTFHVESGSVWNVSKDANLQGEGKSLAGKFKWGFAYATMFGFSISGFPIAGGEDKTGDGSESGSGSLDVSKVSDKFKVIAVSGAGGVDSGKAVCTGGLQIVILDESALDTLAGKLAVVIAVVGALGLGFVGLRGGPAPEED